VSRLSGLFVTGTDTGVGKTLVSCGLLRLAARLAIPLLPHKPAESGCVRGRPADALALRAASLKPHLSLDRVCPYALGPPVAPAAATRPGQILELSDLVRRARDLATSDQGGPAQPLLVECAGGLLSPYAPDFTSADLARALGLPVLLVARNGLGTINHTALAVAELRRRRLPLLGIVLVTTAPVRGLSRQRNVELIEAQTGLRPALVVPHFRAPTADTTADLFDRSGFGRHLFQVAGLQTTPLRERRRARRFPFSGR
jgi:dethiobiotin synthetase